MQRRITDARNRLLEDIEAHALHMTGQHPPVDLSRFIRHYYRDVSVEDLKERTPEDAAGAALAHLHFSARRKPGSTKLRIYNPSAETDGWNSTHTIVEVVNDDMPFLVDSIGMALNRRGMTIHLTVHPIVHVKRDASGNLTEFSDAEEPPEGAIQESFLRFEVDRENDRAVFREIQHGMESVFGDIRAACEDWLEMRARAQEIQVELDENPPPLGKGSVAEGKALLEWMCDDHFTFLGFREYELIKGEDEDILKSIPDTGLGILRDTEDGKPTTQRILSRQIRRQARSKDLWLITKANSHATVHRPGYLDYISIKKFDGAQVCGELRFLGLFTSVAYSRSPREIPVLRRKVAQVMERSGHNPKGHSGKALQHILDTFPRDELFQSSVEDLARTTSGIFNLQERQRIKLFIRRDGFRRFFSCLVYVPRDKYHTGIRKKIEAILMNAFDGQSVESTVQLSESNLARVHIIVRTSPESTKKISIRTIENEIIEAVRSWHDALKDTLIDRFGEEAALKHFHRYGNIFPAAYVEDVSAREATFDIERIRAIREEDAPLRMSLYRPPFFPDTSVRFKLFQKDNPLPISDVLPMLENMGLKVISERPYSVTFDDDSVVWIQDFEMEWESSEVLYPAEVNEIFQNTFANTLRGYVENDGFNRLVLGARLTWRQVSVLRAYCRYLLQTGIPFSQQYMEQVLCANAEIGGHLVRTFELMFDPGMSDEARESGMKTTGRRLKKSLDSVASLDEDRILRSYLDVINATLRTNFYQHDDEDDPKPYISFKFDPEKIPELPLPRPMFEVFVYSPRVEGVHLRRGRVARGGLRWSDRKEDFRTEVLGLMKAQNVKNTLIVPMGAKGGFVAKRLPEGPREAVQDEVVYCYRSFIRGLLDITDNLVEDGLVPPDRVIRRDGDDPYLVVAADKGTATFSDIANALADDYGFWLGDAFASGGSVGYDHKKMGITARGAWEAVKRHFREIGLDTQTTEFTAAGIGDMGGDVFGNGMLQSRFIRLRAAFNHMHIFLDPDPDPEKSFKERTRLFELPRSTWEDYDSALISKGGGVYSRFEKSIPLNARIREMLDVEDEAMTPQQLIRAILKMPVDLIWNGGIGTYVKASRETHQDAGDRANDAVRVNADELRCQVIGEGGNLGLTQLGRIEYSLNGGRINTDFIDNSAGVDCSDHEVNIKIMLNLVSANGDLSAKRRDKLLLDMTDEVAELVLRNNYLQTQAISMMETQALERVREHAYLMRSLERNGDLDRALEFLPQEDEIMERRKTGKGFTRPELSVMVSYSKIAMYNQLINSDVPEDPYLAAELERYFPGPVRRRYKDQMQKHRLNREIIATAITNSLINRMGPVFALRMQEETGADMASIARAYTISREVFNVRQLWTDIEALDNQVHANVQYSMMFQTTRLLKHTTHWLLDSYSGSLDIDEAVSKFQPGVETLNRGLAKMLIGRELRKYTEGAQLYSDIGVPADIAQRIAGLNANFAALDIVDTALQSSNDVNFVAGVYFQLGRGLKLDWIRDQIENLGVEGQWQAMARGSLRDNLYALQCTLTAQLIDGHLASTASETVVGWLEQVAPRVSHAKRVFAEMRSAGSLDFPTLSVAMQEIRKLADA